MTRSNLIGLVALGLVGCGRLGFEPSEPSDDSCGVAGALGHWSFDTDTVDGTRVADVSGRGHDGVLAGTPPPVVTAGRVGEALDFSGTDVAFVDVPGLPVDASPTAATSVAMWFFTAEAAIDEVLVYLPPGPGPAPPRYDLWLTIAGNNTPSLCINTGLGDCWGRTDPALVGRWVHVVAVFANGPTVGGTLFVDGAPVAMACQFGVCDQTRVAQLPVTLGGSDDTYAWHGLLDDVRIYDRALSAGEAAALAACAPQS